MFNLMKDLYYPNEWTNTPNLVVNEFHDTKGTIESFFKEYCDLGLYKPDCTRDKVWNETGVTIVSHFYPSAGNSFEFHLGYLIMCAFFIVDDFFDRCRDNAKVKINTTRLLEIVSSNGENVPESIQIHERFLLKYVLDSLEYCKGNPQKLRVQNLIFQGWVNYINTQEPFISFAEQPVDRSVFDFIRIPNVGYAPSCTLPVLFSMDTFDPEPFFDQKYLLIMNDCGVAIALVNDLVSFEKEYFEDAHYNNYLYILSKKFEESSTREISSSESIQKAYKQIILDINALHKNVFKLELELLEKYKSFYRDESHFKKFKYSLTQALIPLFGNANWSLLSIRYCSKYSMFNEMRDNFNESVTNFNNTESIFDIIDKKNKITSSQ